MRHCTPLLSRPLATITTAALVSAVLAACGGASTDTTSTPTPAPAPAPTPIPPGPITVSFTSPVAANNVHDVNASIPLQVTVTINGNPAANGTAVTLTTNPSTTSLAPVAPTTTGGAATSVLKSTATGPVVVNATATSNTNAANESLKLYIRPAHEALQLLVPAYFAAGKDSQWDAMLAGAKSYPDVKITAIANPHGGSLTSTTTANTDIATAITNFTNSNRKVVGYVSTLYGNGKYSEADVKATVDKYLELYPTLGGFYLDDMASSTNRYSYYNTIYTYIKSKNPALVVVGNPGTFPDASFADVANVLVTYEGSATAYQALDPQQSSNTWVYNKANTAQAMLAHTADTCTAMQDAIKYADRARTNTGVIYATDLTTTRSGATLPTYWTKLLGTVDALNAGRSLPPC